VKKNTFAVVTGLIIGMIPLAGFCEVSIGFPVIIKYNQTIEEMAEAGSYTYVNPDINSENFSVTKTGWVRVSMHIVCFDQENESGERIARRSEEVIRKLKEAGLRPATLPELIAFGAKYPNAVQRRSVVALGSRRFYSDSYYSEVAFIRWVFSSDVLIRQIHQEAQKLGLSLEKEAAYLVSRGFIEWRLDLTQYGLNWLGYSCFAAVSRETPIREKPKLKPKPYLE